MTLKELVEILTDELEEMVIRKCKLAHVSIGIQSVKLQHMTRMYLFGT